MWGSEASDRVLGALRCQRPSRSIDAQPSRAVAKCLAGNEALREQCNLQLAFDAEISARIRTLPLPGEVRAELLAPVPESAQPPGGLRSMLRQPAMLSVALAVAVLFGYLGYRVIDGLGDYEGIEIVEEVLHQVESLAGDDFEPFEGNAGLLGDWFFLNNALENHGVPPDLAEIPAAGFRVIHVEGQPVAQHAVEDPPMIISILHADKHGIRVDNTWTLLPRKEWTGAIRQDGNRVTLIALLGDEQAMRTFLGSLPK